MDQAKALPASTAPGARTLYSGYRMSTRRRNNTRLAVRVTTDDWAVWYACSIFLEKPLSAIIHDAVAEYIADPPLKPDIREVPYSFWRGFAKDLNRDRAPFRKMTLLNKVIVLRLSTEDLRQWKMLARAYKKPLSVMIRRAVRHHLRDAEPCARMLASGPRE